MSEIHFVSSEVVDRERFSLRFSLRRFRANSVSSNPTPDANLYKDSDVTSTPSTVAHCRCEVSEVKLHPRDNWEFVTVITKGMNITDCIVEINLGLCTLIG